MVASEEYPVVKQETDGLLHPTVASLPLLRVDLCSNFWRLVSLFLQSTLVGVLGVGTLMVVWNLWQGIGWDWAYIAVCCVILLCAPAFSLMFLLVVPFEKEMQVWEDRVVFTYGKFNFMQPNLVLPFCDVTSISYPSVDPENCTSRAMIPTDASKEGEYVVFHLRSGHHLYRNPKIDCHVTEAAVKIKCRDSFQEIMRARAA